MRMSIHRELPRAALFSGLAAALTILVAPATASADSWIDCTGQMVTTAQGKPDQQTAPAHDIFVLDDGAKALHKYSETRKSLDPELVTFFTMDEVKWAKKPDLGVLDSSWEGRIDRKALSLKLEYHVGPETTVWTEQCKPTDAQPLDTAAAAPDTPPKPVK